MALSKNINLSSLFGVWVDAIGLLITAIGETKGYLKPDTIHHVYVAIGEALEFVGDLFQAIGEENKLRKYGDSVEAIGAATASVGAILQLQEETEEHLGIEAIGDSLQAIGAYLAAQGEQAVLITLSHEIESLGAAIETIALLIMINGEKEKGQLLLAFGTWVQASGGVLNGVVLTNEYRSLIRNKNGT